MTTCVDQANDENIPVADRGTDSESESITDDDDYDPEKDTQQDSSGDESAKEELSSHMQDEIALAVNRKLANQVISTLMTLSIKDPMPEITKWSEKKLMPFLSSHKHA